MSVGPASAGADVGTGDAAGLLALRREPPFPGFVALCRRLGIRVIKQKAQYGFGRSRVFVEDFAWVLVECVELDITRENMATALSRLAADPSRRTVVVSTLLLLGKADPTVLADLGLVG